MPNPSAPISLDKKILNTKPNAIVRTEKEVNIAIMYNKNDYIVSQTEEPVTSNTILSFDDKYRQNVGGFETIKRIVPADISKEIDEKINDVALKVYKALDMFGIVRFDFIIDNDDNLYLNEVNTIPGSMANYLFDKKHYTYSKLIDLIVSNSVYRYSKNCENIKTFNTDVLENDFIGFKK